MSELEKYSSEYSDINKPKPYDLESMISGDSEEHQISTDFDDNTSDDSDEGQQ